MKKGDFVKISYIGRLETGEIFDLTDAELAKKEGVYNPRVEYGPVTIIVGAKFIIPGLEKEILKMNVGEEKDVEIEPEQAFGKRDVKNIRTFPLTAFKNKIDPKPGLLIDFGGLKGRVQSVAAGRVRIDFNHPLAGKKLKYHVKVEEKIENVEQQIKSILKFFYKECEVRIDNAEVEIDAKAMPISLKEKIANLITQHVEGVEKVKFMEVFEKKEK